MYIYLQVLLLHILPVDTNIAVLVTAKGEGQLRNRTSARLVADSRGEREEAVGGWHF